MLKAVWPSCAESDLSLSTQDLDATETPRMNSITPHLGLNFLNMATYSCEIHSSSAFDIAKEGNEIHQL